jgi:hypothetical protein
MMTEKKESMDRTLRCTNSAHNMLFKYHACRFHASLGEYTTKSIELVKNIQRPTVRIIWFLYTKHLEVDSALKRCYEGPAKGISTSFSPATFD